MAGNPNCLVYDMYILKVRYNNIGGKTDTFDCVDLKQVHAQLNRERILNKQYGLHNVTYSLSYRKDDPDMTTKDLLDYLDARLRDAKQRYDQTERDIVLGEICAINYIYKYITDSTYRRIANNYYDLGGATK